MYAVIIDLDNCIADDSWRIDQIDWDNADLDERYKTYNELSIEDGEPLNMHLFEEHEGDQIFIVTARPEAYRKQTELWLKQYGIEYKELLMRPDGNHHPSTVLKSRIAERLIEGGANLLFAYDDRGDVVAAYRKLGIKGARVVKINDYEPKTNEDGDKSIIDHMKEFKGLIDSFSKSSMDDSEMILDCPNRYMKHGIYEDVVMKTLRGASDEETAKKMGAVKISLDNVNPHLKKEKRASEVLHEMAETFEERSKVYKDNYKMVAKIIKVFWPDGVPPELVVSDQWHLFELKIVKLSRFAISNLTHVDSIHDDAVYSAMIESILLNGEENGKLN